jgi:diguanylate cyclase (GGDEF)-like protein
VIQRFLRPLNKASKFLLAMLSLIVVLILGAVDAATGYDVGLTIFYLLPIALVSWFINKWAGVCFAVVSAIVALIADSLSGHSYSHPLIPYWNAVARFGFFIIIPFISAKLRRDLERESEMARRDLLTGLPNSRSFHELTTFQLKRSSGHGRPLTLAYVIADGLKLINDRFGRIAGDQAVCTIAHTIKKNAPTGELVARLGGSEFALLLPETDTKMAQAILGDIQRKLQRQMEQYGRPMTFSIGAVTCTRAPQSVGMLIHEAEQLTDRIKESKLENLRVEAVDWSQPLLQ